MRDAPPLSATQSWMYAAISHPLGVRAGVVPESIGEMVTPSATLSSEQRLSVYHRSYHARLLECMESMFPALLHALGADLFRRFALGYLHTNPPESYTLNCLADRFPAYLESTRPEAGPDGERETWPDLLIELASLELAFLQTFDGPGVEGQRVVDAAQILAMRPEGVVATLVPCLRLFSFRYPVHAYLIACRRGEKPGPPGARQSCVVMTRRDYRVRMLEVSMLQYEILRNLDGLRSLSELSRLFPGLEEQVLAQWMAEWAAQSLVLRVKEGQ